MKLGWRGVLGIVLSIALLAWTLRAVEFDAVWKVLRESSLALFALAAGTATLTFPLRARRWRTILEPVDEHVPFGPLWRSTAIGMMVNNVVPARVGELARAFALTRERPSVPLSASIASIGVDRVFDAVVVFGLMFVAMLDPRFPGGVRIGGQPVANWAGGGTIAIVVMVVLLYAVALFPARLVTILELVTHRISPRLEERAKAALLAFASGLGVLRSPRRFAAVIGWTLVHWLVNALALWIGFRAVGIEVPFSGALFLQGILAIGVAVPAAPGFVGVFEAAATIGLGVYQVAPTLAVSWALGYHLLSFIPITVIGVYYASRVGFSVAQAERATEEGEPVIAPPPA